MTRPDLLLNKGFRAKWEVIATFDNEVDARAYFDRLAALQAEPPPADTPAPMPQIMVGDFVTVPDGDIATHISDSHVWLNHGGRCGNSDVLAIERNGVTLWRRGSRTP